MCKHARASSALLVVYLAVLSSCLAAPDFNGTCYQCSELHPNCPSGQTCMQGVCLDASTGQPAASCAQASVSAPSCAQLLQGCGPDKGSCCDSPPVFGGTFVRSYDVAQDGKYPSMPNYGATISKFRLDRYEVTVGRFRAYVAYVDARSRMGTAVAPDPGSGAHPHLPDSGWQASWSAMLASDATGLEGSLQSCSSWTWTDAPGPGDNRPINCISWYEAMAFCIWDGGYLPTEAEWNYAAAGGNQQRAYPWSNPPSSTSVPTASQASYGGASLQDVGMSPDGEGWWHQQDLGGNVWEWTLDAVPKSDSKDPDYIFPCADCAILAPASSQRIQRGGGFNSSESLLRTGNRAENTVDHSAPNLGMRCARPAT